MNQNFNDNLERKSQGEIFGVALFFIIIIVGIIIYGRIAAVNNLGKDLTQKDEKYKLLAEGTLNSILKISTGCDKDLNTIKDIVNFCLHSASVSEDPDMICDDGNIYASCQYAKDILKESLNSLYTKGVIGTIPYEFKMDLPQYPSAIINGEFTNFADKSINITSKADRRKKGYMRAPSGRISWATSRRNINFELYLYYK